MTMIGLGGEGRISILVYSDLSLFYFLSLSLYLSSKLTAARWRAGTSKVRLGRRRGWSG